MYFNPDATDLISQARLTDHEDLDVLDDATVRALAESIQAGTKAKTALRRPGLPSPTRTALSARSSLATQLRATRSRQSPSRPLGDGTSPTSQPRIDQSDLWQEGVIGLMRAAEFDPDKEAFLLRDVVDQTAVAHQQGPSRRQPVHVADARRNSHHRPTASNTDRRRRPVRHPRIDRGARCDRAQ